MKYSFIAATAGLSLVAGALIASEPLDTSNRLDVRSVEFKLEKRVTTKKGSPSRGAPKRTKGDDSSDDEPGRIPKPMQGKIRQKDAATDEELASLMADINTDVGEASGTAHGQPSFFPGKTQHQHTLSKPPAKRTEALDGVFRWVAKVNGDLHLVCDHYYAKMRPGHALSVWIHQKANKQDPDNPPLLLDGGDIDKHREVIKGQKGNTVMKPPIKVKPNSKLVKEEKDLASRQHDSLQTVVMADEQESSMEATETSVDASALTKAKKENPKIVGSVARVYTGINPEEGHLITKNSASYIKGPIVKATLNDGSERYFVPRYIPVDANWEPMEGGSLQSNVHAYVDLGEDAAGVHSKNPVEKGLIVTIKNRRVVMVDDMDDEIETLRTADGKNRAVYYGFRDPKKGDDIHAVGGSGSDGGDSDVQMTKRTLPYRRWTAPSSGLFGRKSVLDARAVPADDVLDELPENSSATVLDPSTDKIANEAIDVIPEESTEDTSEGEDMNFNINEYQSEYAKVRDMKEYAQDRLTDAIWPVIEDLLDNAVTHDEYNMAMCIWSDITAAGLNCNGAFSHGRTSYDSTITELEQGEYSDEFKESMIYGYSYLSVTYNDAYTAAMQAAEDSGYLEQLVSMTSVMVPEDSSDLPKDAFQINKNIDFSSFIPPYDANLSWDSIFNSTKFSA